MTTGVYGGTFDPPHLGHLVVAEFVRSELGLDRIVFIPACIPPHKTGAEITLFSHRLAMVQIATSGNAGFTVDDREIRRGGISYTVDTLEEMATESVAGEMVLLIGQDNMTEFSSWKEPERIAQLARVVVMTRPGFTLKAHPPMLRAITVCEVPEIAIASREIRLRVKEGQSIRYLVPDAVAEYITRHGLYRQ